MMGMRSNSDKHSKRKKRLRDAYACHNDWFWGGKQIEVDEEEEEDDTAKKKDKTSIAATVFWFVFFIWLFRMWANYPFV
jgi:hypothetical protein